MKIKMKKKCHEKLTCHHTPMVVIKEKLHNCQRMTKKIKFGG